MNAECQNCPLKEELREVKQDVKMLEDKYSSSRKIIYERLERLDSFKAVTDERYKRILDEISEIKVELKAVSEQPKKRWDTAVTSCITAIIGGIIGFFVSKISGGM